MVKGAAIAIFVVVLIAFGLVAARVLSARSPQGLEIPTPQPTVVLATVTPLPTPTVTPTPEPTATPVPTAVPTALPTPTVEPAQLLDALSDLDAQIETEDSPDGAVLIIDSLVLFELDSAELAPEALGTLASIAETLSRTNPAIRVEGHTDSVGSEQRNLELSLQRANSVKKALEDAGFTGEIEVVGLGQSEPRAPNTNSDGSDNPRGRAKNRRVEITILNND